MSDKDVRSERSRSAEEDYFRKRDQELIEKMRQAAASDRARQDMGARTGLQDPEMLKELEALGFTPDTVDLLPLVPVVQMAWAEGGVTTPERDLLLKVARARGIAEGTAADRLLAEWLTRQPQPQVFARATRLIRAMLESPPEQAQLTAADLVRYCEQIAAASGGLFGLNRVSREEQALLATLASELETRRT
jgi:hypothetical protein